VTFAPLLLAVHAVSTIAMAGVAWCVQVVHYPLFGRVDAARFAAFEKEHQRRIGLVVGPLMLAEALTALLLVLLRPQGVPAPAAWAGLGLVAVLWASTWLVQVPLHARLERGFEAEAHRRLVSTSWLRTGAWTARAVLATWILLA
jgi:hypothetical protein